MDETGIAMGLCSNGYVISGKGKRRVYVKAPQNREWVPILEAISASGRSIRPLVVFKGQNLQLSWFPEVDVPEWHYMTSENGWTSNKTGLQWLRNVFIPKSRRDSSRTRLLVIDGHGSHVSIDFTTELLLRTPKKPYDLYAAAQALEDSDKLSRTLRTTLRQSGKALSEISVDLATAKAISDGLQINYII
jgi:hypothetical protein